MSENAGPETILSERYEITQPIERGKADFSAFGVDRESGTEVFMKAHHDDPEGQARLRTYNEANHLESLHHDQIPGLVEARPFYEYPYLVTERMPGSSEPEYGLKNNVDHELAAKICLSALDVLRYLHEEEDVVHRDVKEANLVMQWSGRVALVDFELALGAEQRAARRDLPQDQNDGQVSMPFDARVTNTGHYVGTASYISPEQLKGGEATPRSDLYAAGTVLYVLTYGRLPFSGDAEEILQKKITQDINFWPPGRKAPHELVRIMERATQINPDDRQESAAEMIEELERYLHPDRSLALAA